MDYKTYYEQYLSIDPVLARRCWAALLDYFIFSAIVIIYSYLMGNITELFFINFKNFSFESNTNFSTLVFIWILYFPAAEAMFDSTLGKAAFDLKVIYEDKKGFHFVASLKRHVLDIIDFQFIGLIGILSVKLSPEHKRVGDFWGQTTVVIDQ